MITETTTADLLGSKMTEHVYGAGPVTVESDGERHGFRSQHFSFALGDVLLGAVQGYDLTKSGFGYPHPSIDQARVINAEIIRRWNKCAEIEAEREGA